MLATASATPRTCPEATNAPQYYHRRRSWRNSFSPLAMMRIRRNCQAPSGTGDAESGLRDISLPPWRPTFAQAIIIIIGMCANWDSAALRTPDIVQHARAHSTSLSCDNTRRFRMKRSLIVSAFLIAIMTSGCSGTQPVAPASAVQAQPDPHRDDRDRDRDKDKDRDADRDHRTGCPDGQHLFTDRDGRTSCVSN
jgi:hypothetical protein